MLALIQIVSYFLNMEIQTTKKKTGTYKIYEGINGSGKTIYRVAKIRETDGAWLSIEDFTSMAEAQSWINCII
jgi:hypothetical protein